MVRSLYGEDLRGPRRGAKGSCGTPGTPCVSSPARRRHRAVVVQRDVERAPRQTVVCARKTDRQTGQADTQTEATSFKKLSLDEKKTIQHRRMRQDVMRAGSHPPKWPVFWLLHIATEPRHKLTRFAQ
jgi:hypothetical protein